MPITVTQSATAVGAGIQASFRATGGVAPYYFDVAAGGAGGSINHATGAYVAPLILSSDPTKTYDEIIVTDANGDTGSAQILVGSALLLFCEIIQRGMDLENGRVYLWDQKLMQPTDSELYIAVSEASCKTVGSTNSNVAIGGVLTSIQSVVMSSTLLVDFISKGPAARERKEELISVLSSNYSAFQQDANGFNIAKLSVRSEFTNLSHIDGAAIPYRFQIPIKIQYMVNKSAPSDYFDDFEFTVDTDPKAPTPFVPPEGAPKYFDMIWDDQTEYELDTSEIYGNTRTIAVIDIITLDAIAEYPSENWGWYRPTIGKIVFTSGLPFTGTLRAFLIEGYPAS